MVKIGQLIRARPAYGAPTLKGGGPIPPAASLGVGPENAEAHSVKHRPRWPCASSCQVRRASMRPQRDAAEYNGARISTPPPPTCFNEAAA